MGRNDSTIMEKIHIQTKDGVDIAGLWWDAKGEQTALLFHMMPATKESWAPMAEQLRARGLNVLAVDFRGHGESGGGDYKTFTDPQHRSYLLDAHAAVHFVRERTKDIMPEMVLAGASIGANVALHVAFEYEWIERAVLLSPGLNYHGVNIGEDIRTATPAAYAVQPWFVASKDDGNSAEQAARLRDLYGGKITIYETGGHGTNLLQAHPDLSEQVIAYLLS